MYVTFVRIDFLCVYSEVAHDDKYSKEATCVRYAEKELHRPVVNQCVLNQEYAESQINVGG